MLNCSRVCPAELQESCKELTPPKQGVVDAEVHGGKQGEPPQSGHYLIYQAKHYPRMVGQLLSS